MRRIATTQELTAELNRLLQLASAKRPSRMTLASALRALSLRLAKMEQGQLIRIFDSLRPKQRVLAVIRAVMGHGPSETGTPTEYIVGRRTRSRRSENLSLLPNDGSKPHPMRKVTLFKAKDSEGNEYVSAALGDMGATLVSLQAI